MSAIGYTAEDHINRARELAAEIEEKIEDLWSMERAIALANLHVAIAHADATSDIAYYNRLTYERLK